MVFKHYHQGNKYNNHPHLHHPQKKNFMISKQHFNIFNKIRTLNMKCTQGLGDMQVWDVADQWYQKWTVIFSIDHLWNWVPIHEYEQQQQQQQEALTSPIASSSSSEALQRPFQPTTIEPWLNHISQRHNIHPNHRQLLERIYGQLVKINQTNRPLALMGAGALNTLPFFAPSWFVEKEPQRHGGAKEGLAASFVARFVPPYRLTHVPERWDRVFLKGLTVMDLTRQFMVEPNYFFSTIPILGLTLHFDPNTGYSYLVLVLKKAPYGSLEESLEREIPTNYDKPRALALSVTKRIKDLHWEFVHGNVHPRNILLSFADTIGDLADITFMQRNSQSEHYCCHQGGRWPYIAPEFCTTRAPLTSAADIYALGIILWQLVSRITFPDNALIDPHVYRIEPIPGIMKEWEDLIADCLQPDPGKRPNAYTVYRRLEKIPEHVDLDPQVIQYIHQRQLESKQFLQGHQLSESESTLAEMDQDHVWTASVTRWVNHGLDKYPNLVQRFDVL
ncbi:kinase-like domain-containing protein [Phascolomyces articulosus]|uniref:Kinase-like domain-containing protein n=1 Tax=Phascolomyces articulosus TaxID=60185 RepID=A0AAD5P819_9FUNG|nr:kinase-like domain-containing protein [Phascolomyces articulosus]